MIKAIAKSMGFQATTSERKRLSFLNYKGFKLNIRRRTSAAILRKMKQKMINSGAIDVGKPIVPITYHVMKVGNDGKLVGRK